MADNKNQIVTPEFRLHFPNLIEPRPFMRNGKPQGEPKYGLLAMFPASANLADMQALVVKVMREKWPGLEKSVLAGVYKSLFKSGDAEADRLVAAGKGAEQVAVYRGNTLVKASSKFKPQVVDKRGEDILDLKTVYAGCYCRAEFNFVATEMAGPGGSVNRFVTPYVNFVMKTNEGDRLTGKSAKDVFRSVLGGTSQADPTAGLDDIDF